MITHNFPESTDYRQTFLRWHVPAERDRASEVLAVDAVVRALENLGCSVSPDERRELLDEFFRGDGVGAEGSLYLPLPVRPLDPRPGVPGWRSLTEALEAQPGEGMPPGILLAARTGAGKTLASICAFRDCTVPAHDRQQAEAGPPPLAGRVPVRLRVGEPWTMRLVTLVRAEARDHRGALHKADAVQSDEIIEELLVQAAHLRPDAVRLVPRWLEHGPPLLLFLDLNTIGSEVIRRAVARAIAAFQRKYDGRHRCIVTHRSSREGDGALKALTEREFRRYDLASINASRAAAYLRGYRAFEESAYRRFGRPLKPRDVEEECTRLVMLIERHACGGESVISTPLVMHLVSSLGKEEMERVQSLADLYEIVTANLVDEQRVQHRLPPELIGEAQIALIRVALAIQSRGLDATRLPGASDFRRVLCRPISGNRDRVMRWWPSDSFWLEPAGHHPYFDREIDEESEQKLREHPLFRHDGGGLGYLHDSFIYHFQALALREHLGPGEPPRTEELDPRWHGAVVERIRPDPAAWKQAMDFLGGRLVREEIEALLEEFLLVEPVPPEWPDLVMRLARGAPAASALGAEVHRAMVFSGSPLRKSPGQIAAQAFGHLRDSPDLQVASFAGRLRVRLMEARRRWLRIVDGCIRPTQPVMTAHGDVISALAVLHDGRVISGSKDRTICLWDPDGGNESLFDRDDWVLALTVLGDGSVLSGSDDNIVRLWDPDTDTLTTIGRHEGPVWAVSPLDESRVATGSGDGAVRIWNRTTHAVIPLGRHDDRVLGVAALRDGRVVSVSADRTVRLWDPATRGETLLGRHDDWVLCVAALSDGRVATGSADQTVRLWDPATGGETLLGQHEGGVGAIAALRDGRVVTGATDRTVRLWDPVTRAGALLGRHDGEVWAVTAMADGRVVTGATDRTVRVWTSPARSGSHPEPHNTAVHVVSLLADGRVITGATGGTVALRNLTTGTEVPLGRHVDGVLAVAATADGRVVSGSIDRTVRLWEPATGAEALLGRHEGPVWAVAALGDNGVVSGSEDRTVRVWDRTTGAGSVLGRHDDWVLCVAVLADGRVVTGSADQTVRLWDPATCEEILLGRHAGEVWAVTALGDGRVVTGARDRTVRLWDPATSAETVLGRHDGEVLAVANLGDGRVVTGSADHTLRFWYTHERPGGDDEDLRCFALTCAVKSIAVDHRRHAIVTGLADGRVLVWALEPEASAR